MNNKKRPTRKNANPYLKMGRKHWRKLAHLTPEQFKAKQDEAAAKIDEMISGLRAKTADLPKLRAEAERLEDKRDEFIFKVATLAVQINAKLFEESPAVAVKLALKRLRDTRRILNEMAREDDAKERKAKAKAEKADLASVHEKYESGVKLITGDLENWDRARDKFKGYVAARKVTKGSSLETVLEQYRRHGFTGPELVREKKGFMGWWKQEKSRQAKKAAQTKRRGRVKRPASDLRFIENRRHKQGYCQVCGRRVGPRRRRCDKHINSKVLAFGVNSTDLAKLSKTDSPQHVSTLPHDVLEGFSLE